LCVNKLMGFVMKYYFFPILAVSFGFIAILNSCGTEPSRDLRTKSLGVDPNNTAGTGDAGGVSFPGGVKIDEDKDVDSSDVDPISIPKSKLGWNGLSHFEPANFEIISME